MIGDLLLAFLAAARLATGIAATWPDVPADRAASASLAATIAADGEDPALLIAIAYGESRLVPTARHPVTGCAGPMGVRRFDVRRGELAGYRAGVRVLRDGRAWCARRRTPTILCELAVYASGPRGPREGLYRQPRAVIRRRDRLRAALGGRPGTAPAKGPTS